MSMRFLRKLAPALMVFALAVNAEQLDEKPLKTFQDRLSYALGRNYGRTLRQQEYRVNPEIVIKGLMDGLTNGPGLLTEKEMIEEMRKLQNILQLRQEERDKVMASKNRKEGKLFLEENAKKEGVVTLPDGLQYKVIHQGEGPTPQPTDTVQVNYRGVLLDGAEFDSSSKRGGGPVAVKVKDVIPGWREALLLMKVGSKWQLFIPSQLAYGREGSGRLVGPNAVLIMEVELVAIQ